MKQSTSWSLQEGGGSVELVSSRRVGGIALLSCILFTTFSSLAWIGDLKCQSSAGKNRQPPNICTSTEEIFDLRPSVFFQVTDPIELHDSVAIVQDEPSVHQRFVSRTTAFELKNQQMRAPKDDQFECCPFTVP
ncbi:Phosphatidylserine decarboxylase proenzyme [Trichinella pseudospiralis]